MPIAVVYKNLQSGSATLLDKYLKFILMSQNLSKCLEEEALIERNGSIIMQDLSRIVSVAYWNDLDSSIAALHSHRVCFKRLFHYPLNAFT